MMTGIPIENNIWSAYLLTAFLVIVGFAFYDIFHRRVPDLALVFFIPLAAAAPLIKSWFALDCGQPPLWLWPIFAKSLIGALLGFSIPLAAAIVTGGTGMGGGDIKFCGVLGLIYGPSGMSIVFLVSAVCAMQPIPFNMKGTEYAITIKVAIYSEGNLAIKLYQENFGQLIFWDTLTTNLGGLRPKDCGFVNTKTTGKRFYAWIKRNGLGEPTGQIRSENGVDNVEYLFNSKKLKKLDPDGYTYYSRRLKGELGRQYERLYLALRRLANHVPHFHYTDYSGWRKLQDSDDTLPLWIEAEDPAHCLRYIFEQRGIMLRTTIINCETQTVQHYINRRKEDMATNLLSFYQGKLPVYPPWSEDRRRQSDTRHENPLIQTFKETAEIRQQAGKKKKSQKRRT